MLGNATKHVMECVAAPVMEAAAERRATWVRQTAWNRFLRELIIGAVAAITTMGGGYVFLYRNDGKQDAEIRANSAAIEKHEHAFAELRKEIRDGNKATHDTLNVILAAVLQKRTQETADATWPLDRINGNGRKR